jgi:hypothetical protein
VKALKRSPLELTPSQALRQAQGRCREQTAGTYGLHGHGEGVLQTTNPLARRAPGRRKPKWYENPPP